MGRPPVLRAIFDRKKLVVDLFAGGGGTSAGIEMAFGFSPDIAANHDEEAIAMHEANHPATKHYRQDVRKLDILGVTEGRPVGLLWLSPDCKHFSGAKGGKPVDRKIRGLAWEAVRWAKIARPDVIILENVREFRGWGPLDRNDKPDPLRKGFTYRRFKRELERCGYVVEDRELRACDYGSPTTRKRLFLVARCDGLPIRWPVPTHSDGGAGALQAWRTAADQLDFSLPCPSIFLTKEEGRALGVKRPLVDNTMRRVHRGVYKYVIHAKRPFIVPVMHGAEARAWSVDEPLRTITGAHRGDRAVVMPFLTEHANASNQRTFEAAEPLRTQCAQVKGGHFALVAPFAVSRYGEDPNRNGGRGQPPRSRPINAPAATIVPTQNGDNLVAAFLAKSYEGFKQGAGIPVTKPTDTITGKDHHQLVASFGVKLKGTAKDGQQLRLPLHTIQAGGYHYAEVRAFLMKYHASGGQWNSLLDPAPTVVANDSLALVKVAGEEYAIIDIGMRMLTPRELFRCQGFPDSYIIDPFCARKRRGKIVHAKLSGEAQVRMVGNSVPPQLAEAMVLAQFMDAQEAVAA